MPVTKRSLLLALFAIFVAHASAGTLRQSVAAKLEVSRSYGQMPLSFEANRGQAPENVSFVARGSGYYVALSPNEALFALRRPDKGPKSTKRDPAESLAVRMKLTGANQDADAVGESELPGKINYFAGNDPKQWRAGVPTFARVRYTGVYPGIDLVYYGNQRQLEYDFVVEAGANPRTIALEFSGADEVAVDAGTGDLLITANQQTLRQHAPVAYQEVAGERHEVRCRYTVGEKKVVRFEVGPYEKGAPLTIDPTLVYATFLGGSAFDQARAIAVDATGSAYITGLTGSTNFPVANAFRSASAGGNDVFVTKLNPAGTAIVYSTYLGGSSSDDASGIAVDNLGNAYVTGQTYSTDFPVANAFRSASAGATDVFLTKLNPAGSALVYSTYLGGTNADTSRGVAVDGNGNAYVAGSTYSTNFPIVNGFQTTLKGYNDGFVAKFNAAGSALLYSTYLGSANYDECTGIAIAGSGEACVTGSTTSQHDFPLANPFQGTFLGGGAAFVTRFNTAGSGLVFSTYLGGSSGNGMSGGTGIATDSSGNVYVTGQTNSQAFPVSAGAFQAQLGQTTFQSDGFATKFTPAGSLAYSTYLGGSDNDTGAAIAVDASGNACITGHTYSADFPTRNPFATSSSGGAFVAELNPTGTNLVYSGVMGDGTGLAIALGSLGNAYVAGEASSDFQPTAGAFQSSFGGNDDGFVAKIGQDILRLEIELPASRYNPGDSFVATVRVTSSTAETLTVTFADPLLKERPFTGSPDDAILMIESGELPAPFELTPENSTRSFDVLVKTDERGHTQVMSTISFTGANGSRGSLSAITPVLVSPLEVSVRAKPLVNGVPIVNMLLDEDGNVTDADGHPVSPKVEVTVKNNSAQAIVASLQGVDPRARDHSVAPGRIEVAGEFPIQFGTLAPGQTVTREFDLQIHEDGRWEFVALVSGAVVGTSQGFDTSGHGAPIAVGETYPMEIELKFPPLSTISAENNGAFFIQPGSTLQVVATVKNLTTNSTLKFYGIEAAKHLNAFAATLTDEAGLASDPAFPHDFEIAAGDPLTLSGYIRTDAKGAPSGTVTYQILEKGKLVDDGTGVETELTADDVLVKNETDGWLGDPLSVRVIQDYSRASLPTTLPFIYEVGAFELGAMEGIGQWMYDRVDAIGGLGRLAGNVAGNPSLLWDAMGETSRAVWEAGEMAAVGWKNMTDEQKNNLVYLGLEETERREALLANPDYDVTDPQAALEFLRDATYGFFNEIEQAYASDDPVRISQTLGRISSNVGLEVVAGLVPTPKFTQYTAAAEALLLSKSERLAASIGVQEEFLRTVVSGPVSETVTRKFWGVGGDNLSLTKEIFRRFGVKGYLRERAPEAFRLIDQLAEAVWKPELMKPKGLADLDLLLLNNDLPQFLGRSGAVLDPKGITAIFLPEADSVIRSRLVAAGETEEVIQAVLARAELRREEYAKYVPEFEQWAKPLSDGGGIPVARNYVDNGVPNPVAELGTPRKFHYDRIERAGKPTILVPKMANESGALRYISGDTDWVHFCFLDGSPLDPKTARQLYDAMWHLVGFQHPETVSWIKNGQTVFKGKINQIAGYLRGEKALLEVTGETTRAVRIDQNLTRFANDGRNHLIFFENGMKSRLRSSLADVESAFGYFQSIFPDRRLFEPFLWGANFNFSFNNSSTAVLARQPGNNNSGGARLNRMTSGGSSTDVIEIFDGKHWVLTNVSALPRTVSLVPTTGLSANVAAGARKLQILDLPTLFAAELAGHLQEWFKAGQTIVIAPGEPTQEVRRIVSLEPLTLDQPLKFSHPANTMVAVVPQSLENILVPPTTVPVPGIVKSRLLNLSTRGQVLTGDNVLIGGFIVSGTEPKQVALRVDGNSLRTDGALMPGRLIDPKLSLHDASGEIALNDDWTKAPATELAQIRKSGLQPADPKEPMLLRTLSPGAYTVIVSGANGGTGIAVFEAYDLDLKSNARFFDLSTRGFVGAGDNLLIGGLIVTDAGADVIVRGIGPSLSVGKVPISGRLLDPTLQMVDANGETVSQNDDWQSNAAAAATRIRNAKLAPTNAKEAALSVTLPKGPVTILLRGKNDTTGVGLIEIYDVSSSTSASR